MQQFSMNRVVIAALVLMGSACGSTATGPSSNGVSINGRVMDFETSTAVSGAVIQFTDLSLLQPAGESVTTDANGLYALKFPTIGQFNLYVDGTWVGTVLVRGVRDRGDVFVTRSKCISRYGIISDARTMRPLAGATIDVGGGTTSTGSDGWYRVDLGCPASGTIGFNTTFMYVTHANYVQSQAVVGRGISGVRRIDMGLEQKK